MTVLVDIMASLTVAAAGLATGLSILIVGTYWRVFKSIKDRETRLLPLHIMLIGTSYAMLGFVTVLRLRNPPVPTLDTLGETWIYPFITLAFVLGDIALIIILKFISQRGPRYKVEKKGQNY